MRLDISNLDEQENIENRISFLEDDVNRLNNEISDLKETIQLNHEKFMAILLSLDKQSLKEETKKGIMELREYIADSTNEIVGG